MTQSSYRGPIWNRNSITAEHHKVHSNPVFEKPVYLHKVDGVPNTVIVERVVGSGLFPNLHSDTPVQYHDVIDEHERKAICQQSLTSGAQLVIKLAMSLAMGNPFGAGLMGMMMSAGVSTLCGEAATCLVENEGDPGRAMEAMGERDIGKSMLTAYAKQELIKASVNATISAAAYGQDLGQAMLQGVIMAGINTAAAFGAHKIGDLHKPKDGSEAISGVAHKALHTGLGAAMGAATAAASGDDVGRGAASGGFGALMTEAMSKDDDSPAQAQRITQASDLITTILALGAGLDPVSAHAASHNANEHNKLQHLETLKALGLVKEGEEVYEGDEPEKTEVQQQYERGRQRHIKDALDHARRTRGRALSVDSHKHVVENAGAQYDYHHGAMQGAAYSLEYGLTAASYIPGATGFAMGVVDAAYGYGTGRYDALDAAQSVVSSSLGVLRTARPFLSVARGADRLGKVAGHGAPSAAAAAPSRMPACMIKSHAPKADVFKRVAQDDWYVPQSQTGSRFMEFDVRASALGKAPQAVDLGKVHGCSRQYVGDTHVYVIRGADGKLYKVGESMQGVNAFGQSKRAQVQVEKLKRLTGQEYRAQIRANFGTKAEARDWETRLIERYRRMHGQDLLPGNKGNR